MNGPFLFAFRFTLRRTLSLRSTALLVLLVALVLVLTILGKPMERGAARAYVATLCTIPYWIPGAIAALILPAAWPALCNASHANAWLWIERAPLRLMKTGALLGSLVSVLVLQTIAGALVGVLLLLLGFSRFESARELPMGPRLGSDAVLAQAGSAQRIQVDLKEGASGTLLLRPRYGVADRVGITRLRLSRIERDKSRNDLGEFEISEFGQELRLELPAQARDFILEARVVGQGTPLPMSFRAGHIILLRDPVGALRVGTLYSLAHGYWALGMLLLAFGLASLASFAPLVVSVLACLPLSLFLPFFNLPDSAFDLGLGWARPFPIPPPSFLAWALPLLGLGLLFARPRRVPKEPQS